MKIDRELLKGTTEIVVLATIAQEPAHGYRIVQRLRHESEGILKFGEGTLYPLLYKLEANGCITGLWKTGTGRRRRRVYRITPKGRKRLAAHTDQWARRGGRDLKTVLASRLTPILSTEFGGSKIEVYSVDAMFTNATESNRRRSAA